MQSKNYRISDRVHMTEIEIMQLMKRDGVFPWIDRGSMASTYSRPPKPDSIPIQNVHVCFFMRR